MAVSGSKFSSLAIPLKDPAILQYINPQHAIVNSIARGTFFSGFYDSSARHVIKSNPKNAKNIIIAPLTVPLQPCSEIKNGVKFSSLKYTNAAPPISTNVSSFVMVKT
jgi:hypothetical protein